MKSDKLYSIMVKFCNTQNEFTQVVANFLTASVQCQSKQITFYDTASQKSTMAIMSVLKDITNKACPTSMVRFMLTLNSHLIAKHVSPRTLLLMARKHKTTSKKIFTEFHQRIHGLAVLVSHIHLDPDFKGKLESLIRQELGQKVKGSKVKCIISYMNIMSIGILSSMREVWDNLSGYPVKPEGGTKEAFVATMF